MIMLLLVASCNRSWQRILYTEEDCVQGLIRDNMISIQNIKILTACSRLSRVSVKWPFSVGILEHEAQLFAAQTTDYDISYIPRTRS
jgi:hypothetical protein